MILPAADLSVSVFPLIAGYVPPTDSTDLEAAQTTGTPDQASVAEPRKDGQGHERSSEEDRQARVHQWCASHDGDGQEGALQNQTGSGSGGTSGRQHSGAQHEEGGVLTGDEVGHTKPL